MPLKPREMEKLILADGMAYSKARKVPTGTTYIRKGPGKVTIPFHQGKDLPKKTENSIRKQAGLK